MRVALGSRLGSRRATFAWHETGTVRDEKTLGLIPEKGAAAVNSDALKTSAGALHNIPVCREFNLKATIDYLKNCGLQIVGCTEKSDNPIYSPDYTVPTAIIMGSEEDGISPEYLKLCDYKAKIPMSGTIGSLNVSVSAGIILYEAVRQRK